MKFTHLLFLALGAFLVSGVVYYPSFSVNKAEENIAPEHKEATIVGLVRVVYA